VGRDDYDDEESYYEDDDEFGDEFDDQPVDMRSRLAAVLGTSYGISIVVHGIIALLLTLIVLAAPEKKKEAVVMAQNQVQEQEYDEEVERAMEKTPKIEAQEVVEKPIIVLEEEVTFESETPKGTDFSNLSNKNLDSTSANDAYGAGGGAAGAYGSRFGKGSLAKEGGSPGTESAVRGALRWLKRAQSKDGRWDSDGWTHMAEHKSEIPGANEAGDGRYDVGLTGLALLAFLGNGQTHRAGPFKRTVNSGLKWLKQQQHSNGALGYSASHGESIYNHAIATMALCEALAVSRDFRLRKNAEKAIKFCIDAQNPGFGWKYSLKSGRNDTSVTGWMVLALKAAKSAEIKVPDEAFDAARAWFDAATDGGGNVGYESPGGGSAYLPQNEGKYDPVPCMTGVAVICRIFTGERSSSDAVRKGAKILMDNQPNWDDKNDIKELNFYYWYYGTYAMFQIGGPKWQTWNKAMQKALLPRQRRKGPEDGSWDPVGEWCLAGGRVYATAINALTLEIYYRYERANH